MKLLKKINWAIICALCIPVLMACGSGATNSSAGEPGPDKPRLEELSSMAESMALSDSEKSSTGSSDMTRRPARLEAGEINDNQTWSEYLEFINNYKGIMVHRVDVNRRHIIRVTDPNGKPVPNTLVRITESQNPQAPAFEARTYADGRTLFHPTGNMGSNFDLTLIYGEETLQKTFGQQEPEWEITLDKTLDSQEKVSLDIMFLLDSTGSMADEISQIQTNLLSISQQVTQLPQGPNLRFAAVSYRDRGDDYVTQLFNFDENAHSFSNTIQKIIADGGDDYPESLNEAFHVAINQASWKTDDPRAIRLVFLIADAPPHLDYEQDRDYAITMQEARAQGIKVFAVASSGLDTQGEYIFRQIAQQTMGRFIFLLYPTGEQGNLETPHDVGDNYVVEDLDDLVVRLIREELAQISENQEAQ